MGLTHAVFVRLFQSAQLAPEIDKRVKLNKGDFLLGKKMHPLEGHVNAEVQVTLIPGVWLHPEDAINSFTPLAGDVVLQIEDGLLPVGVRGFRGGGEANALVAFGELDIEECDKSLNNESFF